MRLAASIILAIAALLASLPSHAQTYDPRWPVCMKLYSAGLDGGEDVGAGIERVGDTDAAPAVAGVAWKSNSSSSRAGAIRRRRDDICNVIRV